MKKRQPTPDAAQRRQLLALLRPDKHQAMVRRNKAIVAGLQMIACSNLDVAE